MGVRDDQPGAAQATTMQAAQEFAPEGLRLGRPDMQAHDFAFAIGVCGHSDYCRNADDAAALTLLKVGGIQPEIRPFAAQRPVEEGVHAVVDIGTELADGAFADAIETHSGHQVFHAAGGNAADPGLLDHRDEGFFAGVAGLQEGREVAALAQLGDTQVQLAEAGIQAAVAVAVAIGDTLARAFVAASANLAFDIGFHEHLHDGLRGLAEEIGVTGFGQQGRQW
jgi:hypothetical protein